MQLIDIYFDGGCAPNPGKKYGSYEVDVNGVRTLFGSRIEFGFGTNNEAEFEALMAGLQESLRSIEAAGMEPSVFHLRMWTDSTIVRNRVSGRYKKAKKPYELRMANYAARCTSMIKQFGSFEIQWHRRDNNVAMFGH